MFRECSSVAARRLHFGDAAAQRRLEDETKLECELKLMMSALKAHQRGLVRGCGRML